MSLGKETLLVLDSPAKTYSPEVTNLAELRIARFFARLEITAEKKKIEVEDPNRFRDVLPEVISDAYARHIQ